MANRYFDEIKQTGPCSWLLLALVVLLVVFPLLDRSLSGRLILGALNTSILIAAAFATSESRRARFIAVGLAMPAVALDWLTVVHRHSEILDAALLIIMLLFYLFTISHLLAFILKPGSVTGNKLHGAVAAYILMGVMWAIVYTLIDAAFPGAFTFEYDRSPTAFHWPSLLFFSVTTLTTTGYGDIVPTNGVAQSAVMIEQLAGTFYVAILIARLAGLYEPPQRQAKPAPEHRPWLQGRRQRRATDPAP